MANANGTILVVGAGVAGIRCALDLAERGWRVLLTEDAPAVGGILAKLDHQFPNDHCGMCKMLPMVGREHASDYCMRRAVFHDNIELLPNTTITAIEGEPGNFLVKSSHRAQMVDTRRCIGCGKCEAICPVEVANDFNHGLTSRKAVYRHAPHILSNLYAIDEASCTTCGECERVCPVGAIDLRATASENELQVDGIVLATGMSIYEPREHDEEMAAYTTSPDVVTSLEFERLISGSGIYDGVIHRPSDNSPAKRIAWIQCMGSRNRRHGHDFCSSICCMFALKEAVLAHEKGGPDIETTIFYMDMRTTGKGFQRYRDRAVDDYGVKLTRCRVQSVLPLANGALQIRYFNPSDNTFFTEVFDLVVLSTGQDPKQAVANVGRLLNVEIPENGPVPSRAFERVASIKDGVYLCGSVGGLTDISDALTLGSAAASEADRLLLKLGRKPAVEDDTPQVERPAQRALPQTAVALCRCGGALSDAHLNALRIQAEARPDISDVLIVDRLCTADGRAEAEAKLAQSRANRLLIGACQPGTFSNDLRKLARQSGFNGALYATVDIVTSVYKTNGDGVVAAGELARALAKLRVADPIPTASIPMTQRALVVGGGVAGMRSALSLAERGIEVDLLEKSDTLGGRAKSHLRYTVDTLDVTAMVADHILRVQENPKIHVHLNAEVVDHAGSTGHFLTRFKTSDGVDTHLVHGATILATGGAEAKTDAYGYGQNPNIMTQSELELKLAASDIDAGQLENVVMIQCVDAREPGNHNYCSRVCCPAALKNADKLKEQNPDLRIFVLYRDLMATGYLERFYTATRQRGVLFTPYRVDAKPEVSLEDDAINVTFNDSILNQPIQCKADLLVLATPIEPDRSAPTLAKRFGVALDDDGFFQEAESKWRPVDALKTGVFFAGVAHSPQPLPDVIAQAEAAASRAATLLSTPRIQTSAPVSRVHDAICSRCQLCVTVCPFEARSLDTVDNRIVVDPAACQGCGLCSAACPNGAAELLALNDKQTMADLDAVLAEL